MTAGRLLTSTGSHAPSCLEGGLLELEVIVNYKRRTTGVTVVKLPFFDPPRKRAVFAAANGR